VHRGFGGGGEPEEQRPRGRPRRRWKGNTKIKLQDVGWAGVDWTDMAQDRDRWGVGTCECGNEHSVSIK